MKKKLIALLLVLALFFGLTPQANAAQLADSISLSRYAFTTDDNVYREFSNFGVVNIVMEPGEVTITPAFHAIDGWINSYSGFSATSSDPEVATAQIVNVGASPVAGVANSFIGLKIFAKKPGTVEISVKYATFVTNSKYTDRRGSPYFTKKFVVTVTDNALKMDVSMSSGQAVLDWPVALYKARAAYMKEMQEAGEIFAGNKLAAGLTGIVGGGIILGGLGAANLLGVSASSLVCPPAAVAAGLAFLGTAIATAVQVNIAQKQGKLSLSDTAESYSSNLAEAAVDGLMNYGGKGAYPVSSMLADAKGFYKMASADLKNELRNYYYPYMTPDPLEVTVKLTNPNTYDITNVSLQFSSDNLSFTSDQGPWADTHPEPVKVIPAGESVPVPVTIYAKPAYHNQESGVSQLMYTGRVLVQCSYFDPNTEKTAVINGSAELPVYTKLNQEDKNKAVDFFLKMDQNPDSFTIHPEDLRALSVMCPVDVHILDREGNTITVLTDGCEPYIDDYIMAGTVEDKKFLMIPRELRKNYQLKIVATGDGTMQIAGADSTNAANMTIFTDIPLKKGDSFFLDLAEDVPAVLYALDENGTQTRIEPALELNEKNVLQALTQTDVSPGKRNVVAHAIIRALVPDSMPVESFQRVLTLEEYAAMMVNLCERQLDMYPGELTDLYLEASPEDNPASLSIAVAAWKGLLDWEYSRIASEADASTRLLTEEEVLMVLKNYCVLMELPEDFSWEVTSLTLEQMICMVDALWQAKALADRDGEFLVPLVESVLDEMTGYMTGATEEDPVVYFREKETQRTTLRNSMVYYPGNTQGSPELGNVTSIIKNHIEQQIEWQKAGVHKGAPVDAGLLDQSSFDIQVGLTGSGANVTDAEGWTYTWYPFLLKSEDGKRYGNTVYLFVARTNIWFIEDGFEGEQKEVRAMETFIIADQDSVGNFLATQYLLDQITDSPRKYRTLGSSSKGADVAELQEVLIERGTLKGQATGEYGKLTRQAVLDTQKQLGLTATGTADATFQGLIFGKLLAADIQLTSWLAPYIRKAEANAATLFAAP